MEIKIPSRSFLIVGNEFLLPKLLLQNKQSEKTNRFVYYFGENLFYSKHVINDCIIFFIGEFYHPTEPEKSNVDVIKYLIHNCSTIEEIYNKTYSIFGKWIIISESNNSLKLYGDPHCTKSVKYHKDKPIISDNAYIIATYLGEQSIEQDQSDKSYYQFFINEYKTTRWWCGDYTFFPNIKSLLPNHVLNIDLYTKIITAKRFILSKSNLTKNDHEYYDYCIKRSKILLEGFFMSLIKRHNYALTLTGGFDSRIIFAASNNVDESKKAKYFITQSKSMSNEHPDIKIPKQITNYLNLDFSIFKIKENYDTNSIIKEYFPDAPVEAYSRHNFSQFYQNDEYKYVYGLIPETISSYYYNRLFKIKGKHLSDLARHNRNKISIKAYDSWLESIEISSLPPGYGVLDLFYWEHRGGRWASQYVNITDLFQDSLWGFNCREFYDMWIQCPYRFRSWPQRKNLFQITKALGDKYVQIPYQKPTSLIGYLRAYIEKNPYLCILARQVDYNYRLLKKNWNFIL